MTNYPNGFDDPTTLPPVTGGSPPGGPAGGDLSSTYPNPTVVDLTMTGEAQGSILYFNGTNWVQLAPGTSGKVLQTLGAGANPIWATVSGGGGSIVPLTNVYFVDSDTTVSVPDQDGSIAKPFSSLQTAVDTFPGSGGALIVVNNTPGETYTVEKDLNITDVSYDGNNFGTINISGGSRLTIRGNNQGTSVSAISAPLSPVVLENLSFTGSVTCSSLYYDNLNRFNTRSGTDIGANVSSISCTGIVIIKNAVISNPVITAVIEAHNCVINGLTLDGNGFSANALDNLCNFDNCFLDFTVTPLSNGSGTLVPLRFTNCQFYANGGMNINTANTLAEMVGCEFLNSALGNGTPGGTVTVTFTGSAGVLRLDAFSNYWFKNATESIVNGSKLVTGDLTP